MGMKRLPQPIDKVPRPRYARPSDHATKDRRWAGLRLAALRRDGFKCVKCGSRKNLEVDHVQPVRDAPGLAFNVGNLQVLCRQCHSSKTRREIHGPLHPDREAWRDLVINM